MRKKVIVVALLAAAVGVFILSDLDRLLSLEALKSSVDHFRQWQAHEPLLVGVGFFLAYVLVVALSVPGAVVMTLGAGAVFGLGWGIVIVSFASSLGALLAFLVARHLLRDWVQERFANRLQAINAGVAREGAFYLFTLRLVPIFPFFLINLVMGLTPLRARTFYWVSQLGMLAGTVVYVNAGVQLAGIDSLSGIISPPVMLSFILLGCFPLLAKAVPDVLRRRRVFARWRRPASFDRNLIVIGGGAAGLVTAYIAAAVKARVTLVEAHKMGGDCLNYGCVPSKALIKTARLAEQIRHGAQYGLKSTPPQFNFRDVMARVQRVISEIAPHDSIERYTTLGVDVVSGRARLVDPWTVEIARNDGTTQCLTARSIVIATGARPFVPPLPGIDAVGYLTSETVWEAFSQLDEPPSRMVILGGGPIGCELAQSFARLGSSVSQIELAPRLLMREDEEVGVLAQAALVGSGVTVLTAHEAVGCETTVQDGVTQKFLVTRHAGALHRTQFDVLVCAVGRVARLEGFGLEELGVPVARTINTNAYLETLYPNIFAAGDVAGPYQFTHVAAHQAWYAAVNALFGRFKRFKVDYAVIPRATFIDPEIASVGINEQEARIKGVAFEVTRYDLGDLDRALADGVAHGFVKVLTVPGRDRILGVTIVGEHAGDLLAEFVLAMKYGLGLNKILSTIHTYPTMAEANKLAAGEWRRHHAPKTVLKWLAWFHKWQRG